MVGFGAFFRGRASGRWFERLACEQEGAAFDADFLLFASGGFSALAMSQSSCVAHPGGLSLGPVVDLIIDRLRRGLPVKLFCSSRGNAFDEEVKSAVQDQADVGGSAELSVGPDKDLRGRDSASQTEELERVEQIGKTMGERCIARVKIFVEDFAELSAEESESELVPVPAALLSEVAFGGKLKEMTADGNGALIEVDGEQPLPVGELQPMSAVE